MLLLKTYLTARLKLAKVFFMSAIFGVLTQCFFAFFRILIIDAFMVLADKNAVAMQSKSMITYIWLTQAFLGISPWNTNRDDMDLIRTGNIVYELARPVDLHSLLFVKTWSQRIVNTLIRAIPIFVLNLLVFPLVGLQHYSITANSGMSVLIFSVSLFLAFLLSSCITVSIYSISLYTVNASNFTGIFGSIAMLLSGTILPLALFPDFLQPFFTYQPFKSIVDTPAMILSGNYSNGECVFYIGLQIIWILTFFTANHALFNRAKQRIILQGG